MGPRVGAMVWRQRPPCRPGREVISLEEARSVGLGTDQGPVPHRPMPDELVQRYLAEGWWRTDTLGMMVAEGLAKAGSLGFRVFSKVRPWRGSFGQVDRAARSLAASLGARGVGPGDVVVIQLPNWTEAGIAFWAAAYLGATVVPVVHFYGPKEVDYILEATRPAVVVTADRFGRNDYLEYLPRTPGAPSHRALARRRGHPSETVAGHGRAVRLPARCGTPACPVDDRSRRSRHHRLHLGNHARPEGRRPQPPDDRLRDTAAGLHVSPWRPAGHHRGTGGPLHRDAQRLPGAPAQGSAGQSGRRLGSRRGAAHDGR